MSTVPKCSCGIYAIGECTRCSTPVCESHGVRDRYAGLFLCPSCWSVELAKRETQRDVAAAREARFVREGVEEMLAFVPEFLSLMAARGNPGLLKIYLPDRIEGWVRKKRSHGGWVLLPSTYEGLNAIAMDTQGTFIEVIGPDRWGDLHSDNKLSPPPWPGRIRHASKELLLGVLEDPTRDH